MIQSRGCAVRGADSSSALCEKINNVTRTADNKIDDNRVLWFVDIKVLPSSLESKQPLNLKSEMKVVVVRAEHEMSGTDGSCRWIEEAAVLKQEKKMMACG